MSIKEFIPPSVNIMLIKEFIELLNNMSTLFQVIFNNLGDLDGFFMIQYHEKSIHRIIWSSGQDWNRTKSAILNLGEP